MTTEKDTPRAWLQRKCPECGARPHFACRDKDGYLANPHDDRLFRPEAKEDDRG
jgi:hypothetical protein